MAIQNRTTTLPGIWASTAQTTIPTPPVAGVTYRDTTLNSTAIAKAWPFKTIVDSSDFNQHAFLQDTLIKEAEQYGIMRWNNTTSYKKGGFCLGQDGKLYQALRDNQGKKPTASPDDWGDALALYQLKSNLSQAIDRSTEKYPSNKAVLDGLAKRKLIGYEADHNSGSVSGNFTAVLQDWHERFAIPVADNVTITIDTSQLTFPKGWYTIVFVIYFPDGAKTVNLSYAGGIHWVNGLTPDFTNGLGHLVALTKHQSWGNVVMSDAGCLGG